MANQVYDSLARARQLAVDCRYLARELADRAETQPARKARSGWLAWFGAKDPAQKAHGKLLLEMERKRAALRVAIDQLLNEYCDDLRASPWFASALNSRDSALVETRSSVAPQRRLIGRMREIRRSICNSDDRPLRGEWNPFVPLEYTAALDWGKVCYDLSRVADQAVDAGLPDLRPHLQRGVYLPPESASASRLDTWMDRRGQTLRWTMGEGTAAISLTIPGVVSTIDQWLKDAERLLASGGNADAEQDRQKLDDRILAAAHAKLPDDLKQWMFD